VESLPNITVVNRASVRQVDGGLAMKDHNSRDSWRFRSGSKMDLIRPIRKS